MPPKFLVTVMQMGDSYNYTCLRTGMYAKPTSLHACTAQGQRLHVGVSQLDSQAL